jgi:hypothetical protein
VREASESLICPPELVAVPALSVLAAAIGSARVLEVKGGWREFPALWTAVVADPSSKKTPAQQHAVAPAERRQMAHKAQHELAMERHREALLEWEAMKKAAAKGTAVPEKPEAPKMRHNLVQDITVEALAVRLEENPRGLLAAHDELSGFFRSHDQYKPGGKGDERQKYLSLWSSRMLKVDRKGDDPVIVERPVVSIAGGIQPDVLAELAPGGRADKDDGMVHRFLFAYHHRAHPAPFSDGQYLSPSPPAGPRRPFSATGLHYYPVHVAPNPVFPGLERLHDWVVCRAVVLGRVFSLA